VDSRPASARRTDLHHAHAEGGTVNGPRHKDFDDGGTAVSGCTDFSGDGDSFNVFGRRKTAPTPSGWATATVHRPPRVRGRGGS